MSGMHRLATLAAALGCISCAEPVPPLPLHAPVIATAPLDLPEQSGLGSAALHVPALHDLADAADGHPLDTSHPLPTPASARRCGFHMLNKVVVPFCVQGSN